MSRKWIRISGAGEFRGEGNWQEVRGDAMERDFNECKSSGFLPVAWEVEDHEDVMEDARPHVRPNYVFFKDKNSGEGVMLHQLHRVATPLRNNDDETLRFAQRQLLNLIRTKLVVDHEEA